MRGKAGENGRGLMDRTRRVTTNIYLYDTPAAPFQQTTKSFWNILLFDGLTFCLLIF